MKKRLFNGITSLVMILTPAFIFAQAPNLGTAANYVLFTTNGAMTNTGISHVTGNVGSNNGSSTAFGNVNGVMNNNNGATAQCAADLLIAYNQLNSTVPTFFPAPLLGNGATLNAGVYSISGNTSLSNTLILDGQSNPSAVFIFQIQGAFASSAGARVTLINGALACNVFWKIEGAVNLAAGTSMKGTVIANNAAITLASGVSLEGRALSTAGAVGITNVLVYTPIGCGSPLLTGPTAPALGSTICYALFSSNGSLANAGITHATGDVGTNVGLTTGFNALNITGAIHPIPDGSTGACAADLLNVYTYLNTLPYDIELLYPPQFGNSLVLTPHVYSMNGSAMLTDTLFLNAQGNANAVFVIKVYGAFATSTFAQVVLTNGTQAKNVFWMIDGATSINNFSSFIGTIICNNGAVSLNKGMTLNGRALTTDGAFSVDSINVTLTPGCTTNTNSSAPQITLQPTDKIVCADSAAKFVVIASGTALSYQWRKGNTVLNNGGPISGANSAILIINPATLADASANYNVIVTGSAAPADTSADASLVVKTCKPVGILSFQPNSENETAYFFPNPFSANLTVKLTDASELNSSELNIYNAVGILVLNKTLSDKITLLNTNLPAGIYFYKVFGKNKIIQSGKLVSE